MSYKTVHYCDRCGTEINSLVSREMHLRRKYIGGVLTTTHQTSGTYENPQSERDPHGSLCAACLTSLTEWWKQGRMEGE